jgi:hypothetical protein
VVDCIKYPGFLANMVYVEGRRLKVIATWHLLSWQAFFVCGCIQEG